MTFFSFETCGQSGSKKKKSVFIDMKDMNEPLILKLKVDKSWLTVTLFRCSNGAQPTCADGSAPTARYARILDD
jgi:hypothetical protein